MTETKIIKPFTEPGFTMFNNCILDHIMPKLRPNAWKVLCVAIRQTWGWEDKSTESGRKEEDEISYSQFLDKTGIGSKTTLSNAIQECLEKRYLMRRQIGKHPGTRKPIFAYRLNKDYELEIASTENGLEASTESVPDESCPGTEDVLESDEASTESVQTKESPSSNKLPLKEKKQSDFPEKTDESLDDQAIIDSIADDFMNNRSPEDLQRATLAKREKAGGNYAAPPTAGGDDAAAHAGLVALHQAKGGSPPRLGTGTYVKELEAIGQALRDRAETAPEVAVLAAQIFVGEKPKLACPHYKSFVGDYGEYLGRARGILDKQCAKPPPGDYEPVYGSDPEPVARDDGDCPIGAAIKGEIRLQMDRPTYQTYVEPSAFVCGDGVLTVTAPDETRRGWLADRLADTVRRTAVGVAGGAVEVRFEAAEEAE